MRRSAYFADLPARLQPQTDVPVGKLEWREVPGYPDYEISTFGLVRRRAPGHRDLVGGILRPSLSDGVYPTVALFREGRGRTERVHGLLARAFVRAPRAGEVVRHLDGRPQIPTAWTVGYGDHTENARDRRQHAAAMQMDEPSAPLLAAACATVDMLLLGATMNEASARWGMSPSKAAKLRTGRRHEATLALLHQVIARVRERAVEPAGRRMTARAGKARVAPNLSDA